MKRFIYDGEGIVPKTILEKFERIIYQNHNHYRITDFSIPEPKLIVEEKYSTQDFVYKLKFEASIDPLNIFIMVMDYEKIPTNN